MPALRHERAAPEFARVANLSDAVFAIAMTLLVHTLDTPAVPEMRLAVAIAEQVPQALTFALAFELVASIWWQHHKLLAALAALEPGLIAVNLILLGAVALPEGGGSDHRCLPRRPRGARRTSASPLPPHRPVRPSCE